MHTTVLLLEEGTALAFLGVIAIVVIAVLALAIVALLFGTMQHRQEAPAPQPRPAAASEPLPVALPRAMTVRRRPSTSIQNVEIDVPTRHADSIIQALQAAGWSVRDTGGVVATDEDEEGLTTISVDVPADVPAAPSRVGTGEEIR
jgi:Na+-transporting methylmalonyl-CoA/oxaloacetate decarboxylase gamma subunit